MKDEFENPTEALQAAIKKLKIFTHPEAGNLDVHEDGSLLVTKRRPLEGVVNLARHFIIPLFSEQARQERQKKLSLLKEEILSARDIIQSHSSLIEKLKKGLPAEQQLAFSAVDAIKRYNSVLDSDYSSWVSKYDFYNFERNQLLLDEEIKGQKIELPHVVSMNFESPSSANLAQKSLQDLSKAFVEKAKGVICAHRHPTHKKTVQFMLDTFRMKAVRMIQSHLNHPHSMSEILDLVKKTPITTEEQELSAENLIIMRQVVEDVPGFRIILTGAFKRLVADSKFISMPILESFHFASQVIHGGFPYPSQHTSWALSEKLVEAYPLRGDQAPLFQQMDQRRKRLTQSLLFDQSFIEKSRFLFKHKRHAFDQNRQEFLPLHQELQISILQACEKYSDEAHGIFQKFYELVESVQSPFDMLNYVQQKLNNLLIKDPAAKLEEEWLEVKGSFLRKARLQEKLNLASQLLEKERIQTLSSLDITQPVDAYLHLMGAALSEGAQKITLQYFSERIGYAPPVLTEFEQKMQACAFYQLISFFDEFQEKASNVSLEEIKGQMLRAFQKDIQIFRLETIEELDHIASKIVQELEVYFPSRHFARYPRKSYIPSMIEKD